MQVSKRNMQFRRLRTKLRDRANENAEATNKERMEASEQEQNSHSSKQDAVQPSDLCGNRAHANSAEQPHDAAKIGSLLH
jgi:hypothetical protein